MSPMLLNQEFQTPDDLSYHFQPVSNGAVTFAVRASNDAHIALTSEPRISFPMYEVFIGGWSNTKSVIRLNQKKPDLVEADTPDILSANEFRKFWITWNDNTIAVGKEGESQPFLTHTNDENVVVNFYGICTGWGATGTWLLPSVRGEVVTRDSGEFSAYKFNVVCQGMFEFSVKARGFIYVGLTTAPRETNPMFEIIVGCSDNSVSLIRYRTDRIGDPLDHRKTIGILNPKVFRKFTVIWKWPHIRLEYRDNVLLSYNHNLPFGVTHIGVRTAHGINTCWKIHRTLVGIDHSSVYLKMLRERREDEGEEELRETNKDSSDESEEADGDEAEEAPSKSALSSSNACWVRRANGEIPEGAVEGGVDIETGETLYIGRAEHEGALLPGKFVPSHGVTYVPWGGAEHGKSEYEILTGCQATWVQCRDGEIPSLALEGGKSEDGETLYIGRVNDGDKFALGKVQASHKVCYIPYGGNELAYPEYEVLVAQ